MSDACLFCDDDEDDHFLMRQIIEELFPTIMLNQFYSCEELLRFIADTRHHLPQLIFLDQFTQAYRHLMSTKAESFIPALEYSHYNIAPVVAKGIVQMHSCTTRINIF